MPDLGLLESENFFTLKKQLDSFLQVCYIAFRYRKGILKYDTQILSRIYQGAYPAPRFSRTDLRALDH